KAILEYSAIQLKTTPATDALAQGSGEINAAGAVQLAGAIDPTVKDGAYWLAGGVTESSTIGSTSYAWSDNIIWGTNVLSGNFLFTHGVMFDDNIIWGTGVLGGTKLHATAANDNIIWGTGIAAHTNVVW